ncbi:MAG: hypothetical protein PVI30_07955 [Myxococcales bacterium]|jgi:hypothetical protein
MNKMTIIALLFALTAGGWLAPGRADASSEKGPASMRDLAPLVGRWQGPVTMEAGGQTTKGKASLDCRWASGGYAVLCETSFVLGGQVQKETDLFGYDPTSGRYHWFAICSSGDTHDHVATTLQGGHSEWRYEGQSDGKKLVESIVMTIAESGREARFQSTVNLGGQRVAALTGKIEKRGR